jgi:hypothetical protein
MDMINQMIQTASIAFFLICFGMWLLAVSRRFPVKDEEQELKQRIFWDNLVHDLYVVKYHLFRANGRLSEMERIERRNAKLEREALKQWKRLMKRRAQRTNMLEFYSSAGKSREHFERILAVSYLQRMRELRPDAKADRRRHIVAFRSLPPFPLP